MGTALSSLVVGDRVVSSCDDGLLEAEYCLFDPAEVVLSPGHDGGVREHGYLTSARLARARLLDMRIDRRLADDAFAALRVSHRRALARTPDVLRVIDRLGAYEAFEGGTFSIVSGRYTGRWLDLDALAEACPLRGAAMLLQALHLLLVLEEVADDCPVRLLTANVTQDCRPDTRTWQGRPLDSVDCLPAVLRTMRLPARSPGRPDRVEVRDELLRTLRERATAATESQPRLHALAALLARSVPVQPARQSARRSPASALLSDARLSPPRAVTSAPVLPQDDALERFDDLRRHVELLRGDDQLRAVAQFFSSQAALAGALPELSMLAARMWLAAGEPGHARYFAQRLAENLAVPPGVRRTAVEILEATPSSSESPNPPRSTPFLLTREREPPTLPRMRTATLLLPRDGGERATDVRRILPDPPGAFEPHPDASERPTLRQLPIPWCLPASPPAAAPPAGPEIVETLALPPGTREDMLDPATVPSDPRLARIAMTRLARQVGRDYRLWYGTTLLVDLAAIEAMQRHLRRRFADEELDAGRRQQLQAELTRHGALLSEILARSLGAEWVDLSSERPEDWTMMVPWRGARARVSPIGRVHRFFLRGHREPDLVAAYTELEDAHARPA